MRLALFCLLFLFAAQIACASEANPAPPRLLLANVLRESTDVTQYWVSEKLDGARAIWNGKELHFRSGRRVSAPAWFTENFPAQPLDGELWLARGEFDRLSGIVRKEQADDAEWRLVRYMLFELPAAPGTFSQRIEQMQAIVAKAQIPWLQAIEQFRVRDREELQQRLSNVLKQRGEGLMLHRADALYATGRSDDLLKLKPWLDAEATVIEHLPGKGKYRGMLGALRLEMPDGKRFNLGTGFSDAVRRNPPAVGALVTYRYRELNPNGIPRFASYLRVRVAF
ncbi:MAG: DNA ligase [Hydrogenophilales bacterium 28-61-23]|nr:MAG: DNA ligase [Hydrogenophilales bacterium 28-61-23]